MSGFERIRRRLLKLRDKAAIGKEPAKLLALLLLLNFVIPPLFGEFLVWAFALFSLMICMQNVKKMLVVSWVIRTIQVAFVLTLNIKTGGLPGNSLSMVAGLKCPLRSMCSSCPLTCFHS